MTAFKKNKHISGIMNMIIMGNEMWKEARETNFSLLLSYFLLSVFEFQNWKSGWTRKIFDFEETNMFLFCYFVTLLFA